MSLPAMAAAFVKAQAAFTVAIEGGTNPHFKSKFARLTDLMDACGPALRANGFAIRQTAAGSDDAGVTVTTELLHQTGESLRSEVRVPLGAQATAQAAGSAISYARRYGLALACGLVAGDDDDGTAATAAPAAARSAPAKTKVPMAEKSDDDLARLLKWAEKEGKSRLTDEIRIEQDRRRSL